MATNPAIVVVLRVPYAVPTFVKLGHTVVQSMTNNAWFPTPDPTLAAVTAAFSALDAAETLAHTRALGMADARDVKLASAKVIFRQVKLYVQEIAEGNPENAVAIAASAGMTLKATSTPKKAPFAAENATITGAVELKARAAAARAAYEWQWSLDQKTWTVTPCTLRANTTITGLPVGATVFFRYRAVTKAGEGDWSQILALTVK